MTTFALALIAAYIIISIVAGVVAHYIDPEIALAAREAERESLRAQS